MCLCIAVDQRGKLLDQRIDVDVGMRRFLAAGEGTHAPDDVSRPHSLVGNELEGRADLFYIGVRQAQKPVTGVRIRRHGREWLIELVGDSRGHLTDRGQPGDVGEPVLKPMRLGLHTAVSGDVVDEAYKARRFFAWYHAN